MTVAAPAVDGAVAREELESRVLIHAPVGRDAELLANVLCEAEMTPQPCAGASELGAALRTGAGAVLLTQEGLTAQTLAVLDDYIRRQEPWSDLPIVVLVSGGRRRGDTLVASARQRSMAVLERPTRRPTLITVLRAAVRARERQYEIRGLLRELEESKERLERRVRQRTEQLSASNARLTAEVRERIAAAEQLEEARAEAEAERRRVSTILESISDAFVALDERFRFTYVNARAAALFAEARGGGDGDLVGRSLWEVLPESRSGTLGEALRRVLETRTPAHLEELIERLATWFQVHAYPSEDGLAVYLQDITARKRTEAELREAVEAVMSDTAWFSRSLLEKLANVRARNAGTSGPGRGVEIAQLTRRERQVLERLAEGWDNAQIAEDLGLAVQTVRNYVTNIYEKLGVHSRAEAVVWARDRGLSAP